MLVAFDIVGVNIVIGGTLSARAAISSVVTSLLFRCRSLSSRMASRRFSCYTIASHAYNTSSKSLIEGLGLGGDPFPILRVPTIPF